MSVVADRWELMVSTAMLGTDRRDPPPPIDGPFADLAADLPQPTPSSRLLQQVAVVGAARRSGVMPAPPVALLDAPADDPRPITVPAATATWQRITTHWPVLEDEWLLTLVAAGWRVAPELAVPLLSRHRGDVTRHARAMVAIGPLGLWLVELSPRLGTSSRQRASAEAVATVPELAIMPELTALLDASPDTVARAIVPPVENGTYVAAHRGVLVNFIARVHAAALPRLAHALDGVHPDSPSIGLAFALADLTHLRHRGLTELSSNPPHPESP